MDINVPGGSRRTQAAAVHSHIIPDELLVSLTSTVCGRKTLGHTAHHRHCKGGGIRRPDAVWHHPLGRRKYSHFVEQPTSLTGAGRDISFLCDAVVTQRKTTSLPALTDSCGVTSSQNLNVPDSLIPEEYHIVKNQGLQSLELYEDAFTVQLQDDKQNLRVFPSLRPSGRLEVVQLLRTMDDMLEKAGVDQQSEELTEVSQMEGLLEMVQTEQKIYNVVFHELIRQVSVGCAERGQLLAKLRQRYQSLLDRIPRRLKALHTEALAQRALGRRLTEEIHRITTSFQHLCTELSRIRDHDDFVSQQAEQAHQQLTEALERSQTNSDVVQGYHEVYELQRRRLEAQLQQATEDRDCWIQLSRCLALKVIGAKKLHLLRRLNASEQSWLKSAEHCSVSITSKDTKDLNVIMELTDVWKDHLTAFIAHLRNTGEVQCEQIRVIQRGVAKWLAFCSAQSKCAHRQYERASLQELHADLKQWSDVFADQCERHQGEELLSCQQTLAELGRDQRQWLDKSLQLFRRHAGSDGELPAGQQVLRELDRIISEHHTQLDMHVSGESGIHPQIVSLLGLLEPLVTRLGAARDQPEMMSVSDWLKLEKTLHTWESLVEEVIQKENQKDRGTDTETEKVLNKVQEFTRRLSDFTACENQRLTEEIHSIHMAQTRWTLELLLLTVPGHSDDQSQEQDHKYMSEVSLQKLDEDGKLLAEKLNVFSKDITSSCQLILEEQILQNPQQVEGENIELKNLQRECVDWVDTSLILLSGLKSGSEEREEVSADDEVKDEADSETKGEPMVCAHPEVKFIGNDRSIMERKLGESRVRLAGTDELLVYPATDESKKVFSHLTTVGLLQQQLHDSELQLQSAERRALEAEEALQVALERIKALDIQLQNRSGLEPTNVDEKDKTPSPPSPPRPAKKNTSDAKPAISTKKTKKR